LVVVDLGEAVLGEGEASADLVAACLVGEDRVGGGKRKTVISKP
jgi:hypothetical protein